MLDPVASQRRLVPILRDDCFALLPPSIKSLKYYDLNGEIKDIVNRISVRYQLRALTKDQTHRYIDHQMTIHGGDVKTFDESAKDQIHEFTGGNPRSINNAAIACLMSATGKGQLRIDEDLFRSLQGELVLH